jgi:predicted component of type VI protein secretion system
LRLVTAQRVEPPFAQLVWASSSDGRKSRVVVLDRPRLAIGSSGDVCVWTEPSTMIHCVLTRLEGAWHCRDGGSEEGTYVNGDMIAVAMVLSDGDLLRVGEQVFRFIGASEVQS